MLVLMSKTKRWNGDFKSFKATMDANLLLDNALDHSNSLTWMIASMEALNELLSNGGTLPKVWQPKPKERCDWCRAPIECGLHYKWCPDYDLDS